MSDRWLGVKPCNILKNTISLCLSRLAWSDSHPRSANSLSMPHSLVAPLIILAAST